MKEIYSSFVKAQSQFNKAVKDSKNPHFKSSYANIESVIDAVSKALQDNGLAFMQPISSEGDKWFICTRLVHTSGEVIESPKVELMIQDKNNPQKFGSSLTYFRRYSLMAFFGIPDTDDDGNAASEHKQGSSASNTKTIVNHAPQSSAQAKGQETINAEHFQVIQVERARLKLSSEDVMSIISHFYNIKDKQDLQSMTVSQFNQLINLFKQCASRTDLDKILSNVI